jgi:SAM-dependent methyltransferase
MGFRSFDRDRAAGDGRDLRRPETLLALDAFDSIVARLPAGAPVLDVGAATIAVGDLARRGFKLNVETLTLPTGDSRIGEDFAPRLSAEDASQDAIFVTGLFFFLPKRGAEALIAEIGRVLLPGGSAFTAFPPLWNPSLAGEALLDAVTADGPNADIVRRGGISVRYTRYTSRELDILVRGFSSPHLVTQKNGIRRMVFRRAR